MPDIFLSQERFNHLLDDVEKNPNPENLAGLAREYNYRSYYARAIDCARRCIEIEESHWSGWYELILASGFKNYSELENIKLRLEDFLDNPQENTPVQPGLYRDLSLINYFLEKDDLALNLIEQAITYEDSDPVAYEVRGYIFHAKGMLKEALASFGRSVELNPNNCRSMRMIGRCYLDQGQEEKGFSKIYESLRLEPCFVAGWHLLGEYYLERNNILGGFQSFARARSINPEDWGSYFFLSEYFMNRGDYDIAIAEVKKLFLFEEDKEIRAEALNLIGYAHCLQGNVDDADYYYNAAIAFNPDYALGYFNLAELELGKKNYRKAIYFYEEALKRDPHHIPSITQTGFAFLNMKEVEKAEEMFAIAVELDSNESSAYLGLSECSRAKRQYTMQLQHVRNAARISPENSQVLNFMGVAYQCNRDFKRAENAYLAALKNDSSNRKAANNLAYLYERMLNKTESAKKKESLRKKAVEAWKVRLLACRTSGTSIRGAQNHLRNLGVEMKEIEELLRLADLTELPLIKQLQKMSFDVE